MNTMTMLSVTIPTLNFWISTSLHSKSSSTYQYILYNNMSSVSLPPLEPVSWPMCITNPLQTIGAINFQLKEPTCTHTSKCIHKINSQACLFMKLSLGKFVELVFRHALHVWNNPNCMFRFAGNTDIAYSHGVVLHTQYADSLIEIKL